MIRVRSLLAFLLWGILTAAGVQGQWNRTEAPPSREATDGPVINRSGPEPEAELLPLMPPGNDACASATVLTPGANCVTGTTDNASTQSGEYLCISPGGGISPETVWYRFTATNDSMVIGLVITNITNCATVLAVYGPFAPGGGCLPGSGSQRLCQNMGLIDPGFHPLLTGLTIGQDYLIQVQGNNCGGGDDRFANFCISVAGPASNIRPSQANTIDACGIAFNGETAGGYFNNGTSIGSNNLDNNAATSIAGASEVGDDVNFVINNCSWFSFCNGNASSCNWSLTVSGITNCLLAAPNAGVQAAVFGGTPSALTTIATSGAGGASIITPGGSWASGTFSLASGACAYIVVDGFAGDQCDYTLTLTNVSCPCIVLPVELEYFTGLNFPEYIELNWGSIETEGIRHYLLERSSDGSHFYPAATLAGQNLPQEVSTYSFRDAAAPSGWNYYKLTAVTLNGEMITLNTVSVYRAAAEDPKVSITQDEQQIHFSFVSGHEGEYTLTIFDVQGKTVLNQMLNIGKGENEFQAEAAGLRAGVYVARFAGKDRVITKKFVRN